jgi:hypothetical protein
VIDVARLDALKAAADRQRRDDFGLPEGYQRYIEYHRARQTFERELSAQWPAIRAAFANDQHLMINDSERIPHHDRTADRTTTPRPKPSRRVSARRPAAPPSRPRRRIARSPA